MLHTNSPVCIAFRALSLGSPPGFGLAENIT